MPDQKPTIEVRAEKRKATLSAIANEQERQAHEMARISRLVEGDLVSRLAALSRDIEHLEGELAKIVGMVGTIRAINNRADRILAQLSDAGSDGDDADVEKA